MSTVEEILRQLGPSRATEVAAVLLSEGLTSESARQRVSRAKYPVRRLNLNLPNKERFLFLDIQAETREFVDRLLYVLEQTGNAHGRALAGLVARDGVVSTRFFPIASGLAVQDAKGQLRHDVVERNLLEWGLVQRLTDVEGDLICLNDVKGLANRRRATLLTEDIVLGLIRSWLIRTGWSSSERVEVRSPVCIPQYGQFAWDIVGPSYLAGIRREVARKVENGFIVGDVILGRQLSMRDLMPFFKKWDCLSAQHRRPRLQPMIIAENFAEDALKALRKRGTLIAIPETVFGEQVARDIREIRNAIENAAAAIVKDPDSLFELFRRMLKLEGASLNLRGVLLELIVAHLYKCQGYEIDIRQKIKTNDATSAEIDVKARNHREVVCCECKGKAASGLVDAKEIVDWLNRVLPRIKEWMTYHTSLPAIRRFEFYSSTGYTDDAMEEIQKAEVKYKKVSVKFYCGKDILDKLSHFNQSSIIEIFREQFL